MIKKTPHIRLLDRGTEKLIKHKNYLQVLLFFIIFIPMFLHIF